MRQTYSTRPSTVPQILIFQFPHETVNSVNMNSPTELSIFTTESILRSYFESKIPLLVQNGRRAESSCVTADRSEDGSYLRVIEFSINQL